MNYEVDFLQVGQGNGDAICVRYGSEGFGYKIHVVDGGFTDTGDKVVKHINTYYGSPKRIENVVLSHADNDHAPGLIKVLENYEVGALWMNRPWLFAAELIDNFHGSYTVDGLKAEIRKRHPYLVDLENEAIKKNVPIYETFKGAQIGPFTVLAPSRERYLNLVPDFDKTPTNYATESLTNSLLGTIIKAVQRFLETWDIETLSENPDPTSASNESSVVQVGIFDDQAVLLTADAGPDALTEARDYADSIGFEMKLNLFQVPHHGSRRNVTPTTLDRWLGFAKTNDGTTRGVAYCSIGANKTDYPRKRVSNACLRRGYPVYNTTNGYLRRYQGMPKRDNEVAAISVPFESDFEE